MTKAQEFQREADALTDRLITWRRKLHRQPEIGLNLPRTAALVETTLRQLGLEPSRKGGEGVTGITAVIKGGQPGPVILLRSDMDALPLQEENELPYRSQTPGNAHMCGHDTHTAMLLGAASILTAHAEELCGSVKLMFQPGEEGYNGAARMIADGLLENPRVDAAVAMHCLTGSTWKTGTVLCALDGKAKASSDTFRVAVTGKGTHGATPELGTDVIYMLSHIAEELYAIRSRELSPFTPAILSICQLHAGSVDNILPESGVLSGTFRTFDEKTQALIRRRIVEISAAAASAFGGKAEVRFGESLRPTLNDRAVSDSVFSYVCELCGEDLTAVIGPVMGAEDFSEIAHEVPSVYLDISFGSAEEGYPYAVHSPHCVFNERALPVGAACYAYCAMRWLEEHRG